ncbi:arginine and glutamate-rich protein 1-like [Bombus flavifrons]|uniref:arginine and glutamate-rich protein 1-like n=1 Tax=Bombus flavifrons TaxID=103934 RepID=UPI003704423C
MGMEHRGEAGQGKKEIREMGSRIGNNNAKLHSERGVQDRGNKKKGAEKSSKVWGESLGIEEGISKEELREGRTQVEEGDRQERMIANQIMEERGKRETEEREKRIRESKYNRYYRNIAKEGLPKYLEGKMKWQDRSMVARFRCGNETRAREHWKEEEERRCRLCKKGEEDLRHIIEECEVTGGARSIAEILEETGEGLAELKVIIGKRRVVEEGKERQEESTARKRKPKTE